MFLALLALAPRGAAQADHQVYLAEDWGMQRSSAPGVENWVFYLWALLPSDLSWWAEPALRPDVVTVVSNWTTALPKLTWVEATSEVEAEVAFKSGPCPDGSGAAACVFWGLDTTFWLVHRQNASYWAFTRVWVDPTYNWSPSGRRGAIAHEAGHLYGLHERYHHVAPVCNDAEITVMDGVKFNTQIPPQVVHCDGLEGPAVVDNNRVTAYWSQGVFSSFQAVANGSVGTWTWKDDGWADNEHYIIWYYWDGASWVQYHYRYPNNDVGVHRVTEDRTHTTIINRTTFNVPAGRWHLACGQVWFEKWRTYGSQWCSNMIWLN